MIYIGSDHGGYSLKEKIKAELETGGYDFVDITPEMKEKDDYPDVAVKVGKKVVEKKGRGILICRSGAGMCIAANKVRGVRAGVVFDEGQARMVREHNDINVLCLAADWVSEEKNLLIVRVFLKMAFSGEERQVRRINKISKYEAVKR